MIGSINRLVALIIAVALVWTCPGPAAWAAAGHAVEPGPASAVPEVSLPLSQAAAPVAPALSAVLPAGAIPSLSPSAAGLAPAAGQAQPAEPSAAKQSPGTQWQGQARRFDGLSDGPASVADPVAAVASVQPAEDLRLSGADEQSLSKFMADVHVATAAKFPQYQFTQRDFYAWARFLRHFTPKYGVQEAARRGALYVYGDRLEQSDEREDFEKELASSFRGLRLAAPKHGADPDKARSRAKLAEPDPERFAAAEDSPYQIPVASLVPNMAQADLVMTPTTIDRIEAADDAFALRDYALLLGPPGTEKSAIPRYLAAVKKIPYLAVTIHPGIGTFELVGGYRPKVTRLTSIEKAREIVAGKLAEAEKDGRFTELLESAARVYGAKPMADVLSEIRADLDASDEAARRRILTLAHGLEFGASSLVWQDGYLTYALRRDIWINFEELNAAPTEVQEFLNEFMRSRRLAVTQKLGETEVLSPRPGGRFMLWATMNPETDSNREVLAQTLKNRWRVKYFGHLPAFEQAQIIEKKYGLPQNWALSLVENFHQELNRQARERVIGGQWRDGYQINVRQLLKTAKRWRHFVDQEQAGGRTIGEARKRLLLAREAYSVYGGMMRTANERAGVFRMLDQALKLGRIGVNAAADLEVHPAMIEDLGDSIRIGDVVLKKGPGGPLVPKPNPDYLVDDVVLGRLYEYAKALSLGEPLLLMGDSAAGKTSDLEYLFFRLNRNLRYKNLDSDTAIEEVVGGYAPGAQKGSFSFQEGMLPKAMEEGSGAFLDEFNLNPLVEWLNTAIDDGRLYLPHRIVEGRAMIVAAANPPEPRYPGRILLSAATRSRYTERWVDVDNSSSRLSNLMSHWLAAALLALAGSGLALAPALGALAAWSPAAAAAAGVSATAGLAGYALRPLDFRTPEIVLGPKAESSALPEWRPVQRSYSRVASGLSLSQTSRPSLALFVGAPGEWEADANAQAGGTDLSAGSYVALGRRWISAEPAAREGAIAHELGHLATGELRWSNLAARGLRAAGAVVAAGGLLDLLWPGARWLAPVAAVLWAAAWLALRWFSRRAEVRADAFAATLVGAPAVRAFLKTLGDWGVDAAPGPLARALGTHPSLSQRLRALGRAEDGSPRR